MKDLDEDLRKIEDLADGSTVYEIGASLEPEITGESKDNLALDFPEEGLKKLSRYIFDLLEQDLAARQKSRDFIKKIEPYLGFDLESTDPKISINSSKTFDTTLATALIRYVAIASAELLGGKSLVDFEITGERTEELERKAETIKDYFNYLLIVKDRAYRSDFKRLFLYNGFEGTAYKKVYYDELLKRPKARFILPEDFLVDMDCTSILESNRLTHVLKLTKRDVLLRQQSGIYRDVKLPYLTSGADEDSNDELDLTTLSLTKDKENITDDYKKQSLYDQFETHIYIDLDQFRTRKDSDESTKNIPLPYMIILDKETEQVLGIYKNYAEDSTEPKEEYFVEYQFLPSLGAKPLGLARLIGTNAISSTTMLNQIIDAAAYQNLQGGIRAKGIQLQNNDLMIGPGQFPEVDTGAVSLKEAFMPLPFNGPSQALREERIAINDASKELASTSEMGMLDSKEDIPTNTMLAALEEKNRVQSAVLKSLHEAFSYELQLIFKILKRTIGVEQFNTDSGPKVITAEDFADEILIIPACDPSINSTVQRMMRASSVMSSAMNMPDAYNIPEVLRMNHKAQGLDDQTIDKILKPVPEPQEIQPVDPNTAVMNLMLGKPVQAFIWQNHPAYILVLGVAAQRPEVQNNPQTAASFSALITEHQAFQYWIETQQMLGVELPPLDQQLAPEIQNSIALATAQALEESGATQDNGQTPTIDPAALIAETESYKAMMKFEEAKLRAETEAAKIESTELLAEKDREMQLLKLESERQIAELKAKLEIKKIEATEDNALQKNELELIKSQGAQAEYQYE